MTAAASLDSSGIALGLDIGGTKIALLATDISTGDDLAHQRFPTDADAGPTAMIEQLVNAAKELVLSTGRNPAELRAVGIAAPGYVDAEHGRIIVAGNLRGWRDLPLRDLVSRSLNVPVFVDNDANAAALGEHWRGAAKQMNNYVFLALGTGIGAGVVVNGRIHRGFRHSAGEVGNFIMGRQYLGRKRHGHGNLELLIGGPAIRGQARELSGKKLQVKEAFEAAEDNRDLEKLATQIADYLAITVINISALLDPEAIIFGGGTAAAGELLFDRVRERVERELPACPALMRSTLGEDAQLHGAVFGALWQLNPDLALREELR